MINNTQRTDGCEAVAVKIGYRFVLQYEECNFCTVETLREIFGQCSVIEDPDLGVWAMVRDEPYVWFDAKPMHCTCRIGENA